MPQLRTWLLCVVAAFALVACEQNSNGVVSSPSSVDSTPDLGATSNPIAFKERRVAVVYSETTAEHYFDEFAFGQLYTAMQHQAMQAGVPYDLLSEADLVDANKLQNYDALIIPLLSHVDSSLRAQIISALLNAQSHGTAIITASEFLTYDQNNNAFPNAYSGMIEILGLTPKSYQVGEAAKLRIVTNDHAITSGYKPNESLGDYSESWFAEFSAVEPSEATTIAEARVGSTNHVALQVLERAGRVVHFANDVFMADKNLVWSAVRWAIYGDSAPVSLLPSRSASVFVARNDMDQAMIASGLDENEIPLLDIIKKWKQDYNFVGSYYIDIGNDPIRGQYTNWGVSAPLYADYIALGSEFGTHSWTHPHYTSELTDEELEFEFNQSKQEISTQLGINVIGGAVPGNPENLNVVENLNQWFEYFSGRSITGALGYRSGYGFLNPQHEMRYFNLNMTPDFGLIDFLNHTPVRAKKIWQDEFDALQVNAELPVMHWLWHDYGPTAEAKKGRYSKDMFEETVKYAFDAGSEFVTLEDYHNRLSALESAQLSTGVNGNINASVQGMGLGQFALKLNAGTTIASVSNWYAYSDTAVFIPEQCGEFDIVTGSVPEDLTRIVAMPMRARLISATGNGNELEFTINGEGELRVQLSSGMLDNARVSGADAFDVDDGELVLYFQDAKEHTVSITAINAVNSKPVATAGASSTSFATPVAIDLTATDPNSDSLSFSIGSEPTHGRLSGTAPNLIYTPNDGFSGFDTFTFFANDGALDSSLATIALTVGSPMAANSTPVANKAVLNTVVNQPLTIQLSGADNEGQDLQYTVVSQPLSGSITGNAPNLSYQPFAGFTGVDEISFTVSDGTNTSEPERIVIHVSQQALPSNGTVSNETAAAVTIDADLSEWNTVSPFGLDANESGINGDNNWKQAWMSHDADAFYIVYEQYTNANIEWRNQVYLDTDTNRETGFRGFADEYAVGADYLVEGNALLKYTGTGMDWNWEVLGPIEAASDGNVVELMLSRAQLGDARNINLFFQSIRLDNTIDHYPDGIADVDAVAYTRQFSYSVVENTNPTNAAPVANGLQINTANNAQLPISLTGSDINNDALGFTVRTQPLSGTLDGTAPELSYMPAAGFVGTDSFTFTVNDGSLQSNTATVVINVVAAPTINGIPVAINQSLATTEGSAIDVVLKGSDFEGSVLTYAIVAQPTNGVLSGQAPALQYTPKAGFTGDDAFTYRVNDGASDSEPATVSIVVTENAQPVNTPPVAANQSVAVQYETAIGITLVGTDKDNDALSYALQSFPTAGRLTGNLPNLTYTPFAGASGIDTLTFTVSDGVATSSIATVSIEVLPATSINTAPIAIGQSLSTPGTTSIVVSLTGTDPENDNLTYTVTQQPLGGTLVGQAPNFVYTPNAGFTGVDRLFFKANDRALFSSEAVITINVASGSSGVVSNPVTGLTIDADVTDWIGLKPFADDPDDVSHADNPLNWRSLIVAHDVDNFYFLYRNDGPFTLSWGHGMYIDVDGRTDTGFRSFNDAAPIGADILIEGSSVHAYTGKGNDWSWSYLGAATAALQNDMIEFSVPRRMLSDASELQLYLRASNEPFGGNIIDLYPDAALDVSSAMSERLMIYSTVP